MVRLIRSMEPRLGLFPQAVAFAREIAEYVSKKHGVEPKLFADSKGVIFWVVDYSDYAEFGNVRSRVAVDEGYWEILAKAEDLFLAGSLVDEVVSSID